MTDTTKPAKKLGGRSGKGWMPGQSGNPKGGKPKNRALTEILRNKGDDFREVDGKRVRGNQIVARLIWESATTGRVVFPDGRELALDADQWLGVIKFVYGQIDGPPRQEVGLSGADGGPVVIALTWGDGDNGNDSAETA